ncbi:TetR/AcrR family transcriptional regulator [Galbitalea sp. SE-J8]|uniref:TetR/AcrR family transcriptional regulator n=1 Tax=Galbitalea sp. SE-J8 TaxID=3054952 RepID=UPI00259CA04E|nr:TetR/AcrR family transcriptional regulator [Galbitalea sp. SE-J8]MDM4762578.1 TetR/AcrR family transcriptional regulator [Galbitalea sp. SE-J8]
MTLADPISTDPISTDPISTDPISADRSIAAQRSPWAKVRILETANVLFYEDGIRTVGVDRLISASSVTKATFYKHYGSKDRLILDYIDGRHRAMVSLVSSTVELASGPEDALRSLLAVLTTDIGAPRFRGCAFLNAAAEFPDPAHEVRRRVQSHRDWLTDVLVGLVGDLGHRMPGDAADELILAMDGAQSGGYAGDPTAASAALSRVFEHVVAAAKA